MSRASHLGHAPEDPAAPTAKLEDTVLGQLLPAFEGTAPPAWLLERVAAGQAHGVTVFLHANATGAAAVAALTGQLHAAAPERLPLLIASDQEGGQLVGLGHETEYAGRGTS